MIGEDAVALLTEIPLGTRVVVRYRLESGATDALGYLRSRTPSCCTVDTRRGPATIEFTDVIAAKPIPEPPARRRSRPAPNAK